MIRELFHRYPFIKFLIVGGINTVFGYLNFSLFVFLLKSPYLAIPCASVISILFNFRTYGRIIFKSHDNSRIFRFFALYLFLMGLQMAFMRLLDAGGISNTYIAGAILTLPMALLSFTLMRKFVFHQHIIPDSSEEVLQDGTEP